MKLVNFDSLTENRTNIAKNVAVDVGTSFLSTIAAFGGVMLVGFIAQKIEIHRIKKAATE